LKEKIMSKTNSESCNIREPKERELRDDEVALVSGGRGAGTQGGVVQAGWNLAQNKKAA
jgi:hypothetical protein